MRGLWSARGLSGALAAASASVFTTYNMIYRHGAWAEADYGPLEAEFLKKLKAIEGVSQVRRERDGSGVARCSGWAGGRVE